MSPFDDKMDRAVGQLRRCSHPLDPLRPSEITKAATIVRTAYPVLLINSRVITLREPVKRALVPYLEAESNGADLSSLQPARLARVQIVVTKDGCTQFRELVVDLGNAVISSDEHLKGRHSYIDSAYMQAVEAACRADSRVRTQIKSLDLPEAAQVVIEAWAYATDGENDMSERTTMVSPVPSQI